jgi:phosphohistidine phosphatase
VLILAHRNDQNTAKTIVFMPRFLYLLRHAQSADKQLYEQDHDRELTPLGIKQALMLGSYLQKQSTIIDIIMCSTAERTKATANFVADVLKINPERILLQEELYEASARTFFNFITQLADDYQHVLCVGHNPTITYVTEYLTRAEIGDMAMAGLAIIQFDLPSWKEIGQGNGELVTYIHPEMMRNN